MTSDRSRSQPSPIETWPAERVDELTRLVLIAEPDAGLTPDDLLCLWAEARETVVFAVPGAAAAGYLDGDSARLTLLVVDSQCRREGLARRLVTRLESWGASHGAGTITVGAPTGRGPWPGIDQDAADLRGVFRALGYDFATEPVATCQILSTRFRAELPPEVDLVRALSEPAIDSVMALVDQSASADRDLFLLAAEQGTCLGAWKQGSDECLAALCHSVARTGWIGPLTVAENQAPELVSALVSMACADLMVAGQTSARLLDAVAVSAADLAAAGSEPGPVFLVATKPL